MSYLLQSAEGSDVEVIAGGRSFPLHALILKTRSPYFKCALTSGKGMKEGGGTTLENDCIMKVELPVSDNVFGAILPFIYNQRIASLEGFAVADLQSLFELANYLQLDDFENHMGQCREAPPWGEQKNSPYAVMKACIKENMQQLETAHRMTWIVEQCQLLASVGSDIPMKPLKQASLEILCETCQSKRHFVSAYLAKVLFGDVEIPSTDDLFNVKTQNLQADVLFVKEMFEKVYTPTIQKESALQQQTLSEQNKVLKAELDKVKKEKGALQAKLRSIEDLVRESQS